jgi:sugar phosphate isomerase/epimerase
VKLLLHSYSLRHYPLDHVFDTAREHGWDGIELVLWHYDAERVEDELDEAVKLGARYGVGIGCVGYAGQFTDDDAEVRAHSVTLAERAIRACASHAITLVNGWAGAIVRDPADWRVNGSAAAGERHYELAAAAYERLAQVASGLGVRIAVETHPAAVHDTVAATARLLAMVPSPAVVANPDPGNTYVFGGAERDPGVLDSLAGRIGYFHMKNCLPGTGQANFNVGTADGCIDNVAWLTKLTALGAIPSLAVEYCGDGDAHPVLAAAPAYARRCLSLAARHVP